MAPEGQGAPVLPDLDLGPKKVRGGGGYRVKPPQEPSRTTSVPNFILIRPAVWISIENRHTDIALYVLDL